MYLRHPRGRGHGEKTCDQRRLRLGVRTRPSQGRDTGSIPVGATGWKHSGGRFFRSEGVKIQYSSNGVGSSGGAPTHTHPRARVRAVLHSQAPQPAVTSNTYTYIVDKNDRMLGLSANWQSFSDPNAGGAACLPINIVGSSLWGHIAEWETKHLYEMILEGVRNSQRSATFDFPCDSPEIRRFLTLSVSPLPDRSIHFKSQIVGTELRTPVHCLLANIERSDEFLRICSMCKRIAIGTEEWVEVELAVQRLELFQKRVMPKFTHGICKDCYTAAIAELDRR